MLPKLSLGQRIAQKETVLFYSSPVAYLFLASFASVTLFIFFWVEAFFSRNIADVRPMFEWMPVLMIFLSSTLTMRLWSEEKRTGTIEHVLTQPTQSWTFVWGKFWACFKLLATALILTLPLPLSVSLVGNLDWGPVVAGYFASLLLGAAYLSIGLFVSAKSSNQIVSLLCSVALCGAFYLIGSPIVTELFSNQSAQWLRMLGTGSRFESITRGVLDLTDLAYYFGLTGIFLTLNVHALESDRWSCRKVSQARRDWRVFAVLIIANIVAANLWMVQLRGLRVDLTEGHIYSVSEPTTDLISKLREPLLIKGYFSQKTHPLLAPLVPQIKDLLTELETVSRGKIRTEFVDPTENPEAEQEANEQYGIQPVPFKVADRYQSAIVSSYFNVLLQYGDQTKVLNFQDLIEVRAAQANEIEVKLRNPEYDLARAIKKLSETYEAAGVPFSAVRGDLTLKAYVSADQALPQQLLDFKKVVSAHLAEMEKESQGKLKVEFLEPEANDGKVAEEILKNYGFQPMATDFMSRDRFYFYLTLEGGEKSFRIPLEDMSESSFKKNFKAALLRFSPSATKSVALVTKNETEFREFKKFLGAEYNVITEDLKDGQVDSQADALLVMAPEKLDDTQLFALDQFLMNGGTTLLATSPFQVSFAPKSLSLTKAETGLDKWLEHNGVKIATELVLDAQNTSLPIPVTRNVGGMMFQEIRQVDYPFFIDVRPPNLNEESPITASLKKATLAYASPITVDEEKLGDRKLTELVKSSSESWTTSNLDIMPKFSGQGQSGFFPAGEQKARLLGMVLTGRFSSYFEAEKAESKFGASLAHSPDSSRLFVFSSNDFLSDRVTQMSGSATGAIDLSNFELLNNAIEWSLDDQGLSQIRSRGHFNRTLPQLTKKTQLTLEYGNYFLALILLCLLALTQSIKKRRALSKYNSLTSF